MKSFTLAVAVFSFYLNGFSQVNCGTSVSTAQIAKEQSFTISTIAPTQSMPQVNRDLSIALYVVKDTNNNAGISQSSIDAALIKLNSFFAPISLKFHLCSIVYVDNYQFDFLTETKNEIDLTTTFYSAYVINIYVVGKLADRNKNLVNGLTYMPADAKNSLFFTKTSLNTSEIGHQFGHFFNLYHTHETIFGNELANNPVTCSSSGDKCCDTEADPKLTGLVDSNCLYTGNSKDANSQLFTPSVKNIMSFSTSDCRCFFSKTQYLRVIYALEYLKNTLK